MASSAVKSFIMCSLLLSYLVNGMEQPKVTVRIVNNSDKLASIFFPETLEKVINIVPRQSIRAKISDKESLIFSPSINSNYDIGLLSDKKITLRQNTAQKMDNNWVQMNLSVQELPYHPQIDAFISANGTVVLFPSFNDISRLTPEEILGVQKGAKMDVVKKAYQELSSKFQPDKHNNSTEVTEIYKSIGNAYKKLGGK